MSQVCWRAPNALYVGEVLYVFFFCFCRIYACVLYIFPTHDTPVAIVRAAAPNTPFSAEASTFTRTIFGPRFSH